MILKIHIPPKPLGDYVATMVYYSSYYPEHNIERLLPDGTVNIVIDLNEDPKYIFDNDTLAEKQKCIKAWVAGAHSGFISISAGGQNSSMFVISFKPGCSYPFLHLPLEELTNLVVDAELVLGNEILELRNQLLEPSIPEAKFSLAEQWLTKSARHARLPEAVVHFGVESILNDPSLQSLDQIAQQTGYSHKQFIHLFKRYVGLTPKVFQRMIRFNTVLQQVHTRERVNWTSVALDCGYYDQAHFIKEFREFAGFNPKAYLMEQGEYMLYVPIA